MHGLARRRLELELRDARAGRLASRSLLARPLQSSRDGRELEGTWCELGQSCELLATLSVRLAARLATEERAERAFGAGEVVTALLPSGKLPLASHAFGVDAFELALRTNARRFEAGVVELRHLEQEACFVERPAAAAEGVGAAMQLFDPVLQVGEAACGAIVRIARAGSVFLRRLACSLALVELGACFGACLLRRLELTAELHGATRELGGAAQGLPPLFRCVEPRAALAESLAGYLLAGGAVRERRFRLGEPEPRFVLEGALRVAAALRLA